VITISNIYGHGFDQRRLSKLEAMGFKKRAQVSRYMGAQLCHFFDFPEGPCLEMIEVEHDQAYLDFIPNGMIPYCPGISLILPQDSKMAIGDLAEKFRPLRPYTLHVNYDGSADSRGPGWNYLNFGLPVVRDTFIWLTELESPRPHRDECDYPHPNTVVGVAGLVFDLDVDSLTGLSQLVEPASGALRLGGLPVWSKSAIDDFPLLPPKVFPLIAIVLKAKNLDYFAAVATEVKEVSFRSRPAVHIETNKLSWDLLIITGDMDG
jgi:hypothetical protein